MSLFFSIALRNILIRIPAAERMPRLSISSLFSAPTANALLSIARWLERNNSSVSRLTCAATCTSATRARWRPPGCTTWRTSSRRRRWARCTATWSSRAARASRRRRASRSRSRPRRSSRPSSTSSTHSTTRWVSVHSLLSYVLSVSVSSQMSHCLLPLTIADLSP